jgi:hypothetical protein
MLARTFGSSSFWPRSSSVTPPGSTGSPTRRCSPARTRDHIERDLDGALAGLQSESRQRDLLRITRRRDPPHRGARPPPPVDGAGNGGGALGSRRSPHRSGLADVRRCPSPDLGLPLPAAASGAAGSADSAGLVVLGWASSAEATSTSAPTSTSSTCTAPIAAGSPAGRRPWPGPSSSRPWPCG